MFERSAFYQHILDNGIVGLFPEEITLKSGRKSHWYINWRKTLSSILAVGTTARHVLDFAEDLSMWPDSFVGVPEGATAIGIACSMIATRHKGTIPAEGGFYPLPVGRAVPKDHGDPADRFFVSPPIGQVIVLEDVTTTGGSLVKFIKRIQEVKNAEVRCAIGLTNRMAKRDDGLSVEAGVKKDTGVPYYHMSSALDLLPEVISKANPPKAVVDAIVEEFRRFGIERLEL